MTCQAVSGDDPQHPDYYVYYTAGLAVPASQAADEWGSGPSHFNHVYRTSALPEGRRLYFEESALLRAPTYQPVFVSQEDFEDFTSGKNYDGTPYDAGPFEVTIDTCDEYKHPAGG